MTTRYEPTEPARTSPFPPSVHLGARETRVLFSVLDGVARSASHCEAAGPAGARVARAGASFRTRLAGPAAPPIGLGAAAAMLPPPVTAIPAGLLPPEFRGPAAPSGEVTVPYDAVLDLAAELLEVADVLTDAGHPVEALALEGVSGRLIELVVGAGPCEGTPIGARR